AGLKGLNLSILYLNADNIDTGNGRKGEWERDIALSYTIPEGILNGLGISVKNATMRSALPDTSRKGSAGQRDQDETRVTVSYTLPLL
ncbi:TPA: OprD family outer membrane porin, partial [Klebsiella pneumoniae]|nr:OprD family outer membrane porin [Klebsiella pneumoniae]